MYENIILIIENKIAIIQLNRPKRLNALNYQTMDEICSALDAVENDNAVRVVIITGNERAFAAGADVNQMLGKSTQDMKDEGQAQLERWQRIYAFSKPTIAAVNGWCLGGGNELAMSCDMMVAGEKTKFGQPEINLAIMPGAGGTQRLVRAVGKAMAMEMILASRFLSAQEALQLGLVNAVVPVELVLEKALEIANEITSKAPVAIQKAKESVLQAFELPLQKGLQSERDNFYSLFDTEDKDEGISAFLEKRKPQWKGK